MLTDKIFAAALLAWTLSGCGFRPIYAAPTAGEAPLNQLIAVRQIAAPDTILPLVTDALESRIALKDGQSPKYDLYVEASEKAERLAVQIDATVTRYNYRLKADYSLINLETGEHMTGAVEAVTSYNIVSSQYSTLFAERTAQKKAARLLAEQIERDLLIQFMDAAAQRKDDEDDSEADIDPETIPPIDFELDDAFESSRTQ